jgi:hypothetical protein
MRSCGLATLQELEIIGGPAADFGNTGQGIDERPEFDFHGGSPHAAPAANAGVSVLQLGVSVASTRCLSNKLSADFMRRL